MSGSVRTGETPTVSEAQETEAEAIAARLGCTSAWSTSFWRNDETDDLTRLRKLGLLGLWALKQSTHMALKTAELGVTVSLCSKVAISCGRVPSLQESVFVNSLENQRGDINDKE